MLHYEIIVVTHFEQNCSLLWDDQTKEAVLIDAGGDIEKIERVLQEKGVTLTELWITHAHLDHVGAVGDLVEKYNVPIIGPHKADAFWLNALPMQAQMFGFQAPKLFQPTRWLEHGDTLTFANHTFEVRFTPGHAPGHIVFYCKELNMVWSGDVLFNGGIGRTDFPQGDHAQLLQSIKEQMFTMPDETVFVSGHGSVSNIGYEKMHNPFTRTLA